MSLRPKRFPLDGYNPKRWNCDDDGCFEFKRRPGIELFADCFPGRNSFGDIDYWIERFGHLLFVEWKMPGEALTGGQEKMFKRITVEGRHNTVFVVTGNPQSMLVEKWTIYWQGKTQNCVGDLEALKDRVYDWNAWAEQNTLLTPVSDNVQAARRAIAGGKQFEFITGRSA